MSTSRATAAELRRSVSATSKSSAASRTGDPPPRCTALRTVRTTSIGCSSPKRHSRVAPVTSPAAPASRTSWSPQRARRELQAVAAAFEIALTLQLAFDAPQLVQVVNRLLAERSLDELLVDVVQAGAGVVLQRQVGQVVYLGELGECLGRV